jgi:hypothetical protein
LTRQEQRDVPPPTPQPNEDPAHDPFDDLVPLSLDHKPTADGAPNGTGDGNGSARRDAIAAARRALEPVQSALTAAGFYAYGMVDDQHRWTIASDDEAGRIDVRVGDDGYEVELWASSPGLYVEEENEWRRRARERLARTILPNIVRGFLAPHQSASWDEVDQGIAVQLRYELPFARAADIGNFVRERLPELEELLAFVESKVAS